MQTQNDIMVKEKMNSHYFHRLKALDIDIGHIQELILIVASRLYVVFVAIHTNVVYSSVWSIELNVDCETTLWTKCPNDASSCLVCGCGFLFFACKNAIFFFPSVPLYFSMVSMHLFIDMSQLVRNDSINLIGWPVRFAHIHNIKLILKKF